MNILVGINDRYADALCVMLASLFAHNRVASVYCLYHTLSEENQEKIALQVKGGGAAMHFLFVDVSLYEGFPVTDRLTLECYFILLAHQQLPQDMERILYLDCDVIVDGSLKELYETDFEGNYLAACGQSYKDIEGHPWPSGARPEKGDCFNSGVILFHLSLMRRDITAETYLAAAKQGRYKFQLADQGLLNLVFWQKTKYLDTMKWNFRISMYEAFVKDGNTELSERPVIYHYVNRDYYKIGRGCKPWEFLLDESEFDYLSYAGIARRVYGDEPAVQMNLEMQHLWWKYAAKCPQYETLRSAMLANKAEFYEQRVEGHQEDILSYRKRTADFEKITNGETVPGLLDYHYGELERYIDQLSPDEAIQTMKRVHQAAADRLKGKAKIRVAFMVYSSSEWQCERLYRLMEEDERFEPFIFLCGYGHGSTSQIERTYRDACRYFFESEKTYNIEYGGCTWAYARSVVETFDVLVYISPFAGMIHPAYNVSQRPLSQLVIYVSYCFDVASTEVAYYEGFDDMILFKMSWMVAEPTAMHKAYFESTKRLRGYNAIVAGNPKMDTFYTETIRQNLWKTTAHTKLRIVWAPHWNLQNGRNGTFHENHGFFLKYAKEHPEISWIIRPHPRLAVGAMDAGVFKTMEDYDQYFATWNSLPNARVIPTGDYFDVFRTSDAMILDSQSFLVEYQYTGKPLLFLLSKTPIKLMSFGEALLSHLYTCRGTDVAGIEKFIANAEEGLDPLKAKRKTFFEEHIDVCSQHGKKASDYIFEEIQSRSQLSAMVK